MKRLISIVTIIPTLVFSQTLAQTASTLIKENEHPFLLVTNKRVEEIRKSVASSRTKLACWKAIKKEADALINEDVEIPDRGGNWEHYYINPVNNHLFPCLPKDKGKTIYPAMSSIQIKLKSGFIFIRTN